MFKKSAKTKKLKFAKTKTNKNSFKSKKSDFIKVNFFK